MWEGVVLSNNVQYGVADTTRPHFKQLANSFVFNRYEDMIEWKPITYEKLLLCTGRDFMIWKWIAYFFHLW